MSAVLTPAPTKVDVYSADSCASRVCHVLQHCRRMEAHAGAADAAARRAARDLYQWRKDPQGRVPALDRDKLERLSYLLGHLQGAADPVSDDRGRGDCWIHATNDAPLFNGRSALERMLRRPDERPACRTAVPGRRARRQGLIDPADVPVVARAVESVLPADRVALSRRPGCSIRVSSPEQLEALFAVESL